MKKLEQLLHDLDHKSYPAYKALKGSYTFPGYLLSIDHVQGDPFAAPSSLSIHVTESQHGIPKDFYATKHRRIALCDFILRGFFRELKKYDHNAKGSGKSGTLSVSACHQEILERSALTLSSDGKLILRFQAGFPAAGRTTLAMELKKMLMEYVPSCVNKALRFKAMDSKQLERWIQLADDQKVIREQLTEKGLIAFVADGAILPRKSGVDDRPMPDAVVFESPDEDRVELSLSGNRTLTGMGIKKGVTLIVGGGYHGKSTLLKALERGVYNHIPGDGREYVITENTAMKIRSEDGRSVKKLDISPFIHNLPSKRDTVCFSTEDASGSTSQAACTVEAILSGSKTLLIDEDTSATNFMVRDELMQQVIHPGMEPIIPFLDRMRQLYEELGVSTILVAGSSGAFFKVSDAIIQMREYRPINITSPAKEAAARFSSTDHSSDHSTDSSIDHAFDNTVIFKKSFVDNRIPLPNRQVTDSRKVKVRGSGTDSVSINHESVELRFVEQVIDNEQTILLGALLRTLEENYFDGSKPLTECVDALYHKLQSTGFGAVSSQIPGNLAMVRSQELWAMINRYRGLRLK